MCRQGGYYDQAVFLAKKHEEHELVVDILIEESKKYDEALDYIWRQEPEMAYVNLMKYARVLLENCAQNATRMFIDYYTGRYRQKTATAPIVTPVPQGGAINTVQNLASFIPLPYRQSPAVGSPTTAGNQQLSLNEAEATEANAAAPGPEYDVPKPRTAFSAFVDHPAEFVVFLEACLKQDNVERSDKIDLYTTLFEMYLETAQGKEGAEKEAWETKAKGLIDGQDVSWRVFILS